MDRVNSIESSRAPIESMRDLGFTATVPEDTNGDGGVDQDDLALRQAGFGSVGLEIDSITRDDGQRDRDVDGADFLAWQRARTPPAGMATVPEPSAITLLAAAVLCWCCYSERTMSATTGKWSLGYWPFWL